MDGQPAYPLHLYIRGAFCDDALYKLTFTFTYTYVYFSHGKITFKCAVRGLVVEYRTRKS